LFRFRAMPFGYRDASRILTKVMRTPVCKWRKAGVPSFIHIDDGLCFKDTKQEAREAAKMFKDDLDRLGLVTSPEKCQWEPVQRFVWCGFQWYLKEFRVEVTEEKRYRIRFYTRFSVGWCQALVDLSNWGAKGELSEELVFWRDKLGLC
jgi:hypothetical protein